MAGSLILSGYVEHYHRTLGQLFMLSKASQNDMKNQYVT